MSLTASIAQIVPCTEAEGPGKRFAIWFQGCPLRCPECCNPEMLAFVKDKEVPCTTIIEQMHATAEIEGITLLGGEPTAQPEAAAAIAAAAHDRGLSVMVFTGFIYEQLLQSVSPFVQRLLHNTDILVDGPYRKELPETERRWIGSSNQRIHFLTDRYSPDDPCWRRSNTIEIRLEEGELTVNGFPIPGIEL